MSDCTPTTEAREQVVVAKRWLARTSPKQWPTCGRRVGLTKAAA